MPKKDLTLSSFIFPCGQTCWGSQDIKLICWFLGARHHRGGVGRAEADPGSAPGPGHLLPTGRLDSPQPSPGIPALPPPNPFSPLSLEEAVYVCTGTNLTMSVCSFRFFTGSLMQLESTFLNTVCKACRSSSCLPFHCGPTATLWPTSHLSAFKVNHALSLLSLHSSSPRPHLSFYLENLLSFLIPAYTSLPPESFLNHPPQSGLEAPSQKPSPTQTPILPLSGCS